MRYTVLLLTALLPACATIAETTPHNELSRMHWLVGDWERTDLPAGRSGGESWQMLTDEPGLVGRGTSQRSDGSRFTEQLRIVVADGVLHYVADVPGNPAPVRFRLVALDDDGFAFENPEHDFPKRIAYRRDGEGMSAQISDGDRVITFRFRRLR